mmetsp:Transcript_69370/g.141047  ORF Transcript_69370/g.141047 Transcript_69370/m.141047 type:complete len:458 (-) Transcript_69370:415-1788(-)
MKHQRLQAYETQGGLQAAHDVIPLDENHALLIRPSLPTLDFLDLLHNRCDLAAALELQLSGLLRLSPFPGSLEVQSNVCDLLCTRGMPAHRAQRILRQGLSDASLMEGMAARQHTHISAAWVGVLQAERALKALPFQALHSLIQEPDLRGHLLALALVNALRAIQVGPVLVRFIKMPTSLAVLLALLEVATDRDLLRRSLLERLTHVPLRGCLPHCTHQGRAVLGQGTTLRLPGHVFALRALELEGIYPRFQHHQLLRLQMRADETHVCRLRFLQDMTKCHLQFRLHLELGEARLALGNAFLCTLQRLPLALLSCGHSILGMLDLAVVGVEMGAQTEQAILSMPSQLALLVPGPLDNVSLIQIKCLLRPRHRYRHPVLLRAHQALVPGVGANPLIQPPLRLSLVVGWDEDVQQRGHVRNSLGGREQRGACEPPHVATSEGVQCMHGDPAILVVCQGA